MLILELLKQLGIDLGRAFTKFGRDLYMVIADSDTRQLRRCVRIGRQYADRYEKDGKFKGLALTDVVMINIQNGEFVVGKNDLDAHDEFRRKYGMEAWSYSHYITPIQRSF